MVTASWGGQLVKQLQQQGIPHYRIPIRLSSKISGVMLKRVISKEKIDIVHANSADAGRAVAALWSLHKIPWILTAHGGFAREPKYQGINNADRVICVSDFLRNEMTHNTNIVSNKLVTIYNGIDLHTFTPGEGRREKIRREMNLEEGHYVIGIISRITSINGKGHDDLLQILAGLPRAKNWRLLIIGKGKWHVMRELRRRASQLGIAEQVVFAGQRTDISNVLEAMDVVALPSKWETFGLVLAEAMAMKKPVIAYEVAGTTEAIGREGSGFLVSPGDLTAFAKCLALCSDPQYAARIGEKGRARVETMFNVEVMLDKVTALYDDVIAESAI